MAVISRKGHPRPSSIFAKVWAATAQLGRSMSILLVMLCLVMVWPRKSDYNMFDYASTLSQNVTTTSEEYCSLWSPENSTLLNSDCIQEIAHVFPYRLDTSQWCLAPVRPNIFFKYPQMISDVNQVVGIIFIKNTKAASSTGAGVTLRIAEQVGKRQLLLPASVLAEAAKSAAATTTEDEEDSYSNTQLQLQLLPMMSCVRNWTHAFANYRGHAKRDPHQSLLWTIVRKPAKRDVSAFFFFEHARQGVNVTDDAVWRYLQAQKSGQFRYLNTDYIADDNLQTEFQTWYQDNYSQLSSVIQRLLETYDFIALAERLDESLAVMTLLWNLEPQDVIVLSSKTKGGYDDGKFQKTCHKIPQPYLSPFVADYLESPDYLANNLDVALYAAVNASLDKTILELGHDRVQERLVTIQRLQRLAEEQCQSEAVYPCSDDGIPQRTAARQSCYVDDSGCGHVCVDRVLSGTS